MRIESESVTLGYGYKGERLGGVFALTHTQMKNQGVGKDTERRSTGYGMHTSLGYDAYKGPNLTLGTRMNIDALLQMTGTNSLGAQTGEINGGLGIYSKWKQNSLTITGWYNSEYSWRPNLYPNLYYKTPLTDRNIYNFSRGHLLDLSIGYRDGMYSYKEKKTDAGKTVEHTFGYKAKVFDLLSPLHLSISHGKYTPYTIFSSPGEYTSFGLRWSYIEGVDLDLNIRKTQGYGYPSSRSIYGGMSVHY